MTPDNADLSNMIDYIKFIRSDSNADINNYVVASKAQRATPLFTRATPTVTGLWEITFDLPVSSNLVELIELTKFHYERYLFALAIGNTFDEV